jgi:hypothetical protein
MKKIKNNKRDSYIYVFTLFLFWIILSKINYFIKKYNIKIIDNNNINSIIINSTIINYIYIIFFSFISGLLIYLGYKYFNNLIEPFIINNDLIYLITTSIMITISFLYSAYIKEILEELYNKKFNIDEWINIYGYIIGRIIFIIILILFFIKNN